MSEPPGAIVDALRAAKLTLEIVRTFEGEEVPADPGGVAGLIAMGGPMGVYEEARHPFLRDELRLRTEVWLVVRMELEASDTSDA